MKNLGKLIVTGIIQFLIVNCYAQKDLSFFPLKIGEIEVVALSDGFVATDAHQLLQEGAHGQIDSLLAKARSKQSRGNSGQRISHIIGKKENIDRYRIGRFFEQFVFGKAGSKFKNDRFSS